MSAAPRKRVLMIEQGGRGGVADYTAELLRGLVGEGWSVALASPRRSSTTCAMTRPSPGSCAAAGWGRS
jgi:hypothetical protein